MTLIFAGVDTEGPQPRTKKALKECKGKVLYFDDPSIFGQKYHPLNGDAMVLDHPKRTKFAQVWTDANGVIQKVT